MRIDNNSFYVRYTMHPQYGGQATATHYVEVGDNYYVIREYGFNEHCVDFEDARWNGVNTDDSGRGTRILGRYFNRWEKRVNELKERLSKLARQAAQPFHADVRPGECILSIYEEEEEYDYDSFEVYKVKGITNGKIIAQCATVGLYDMGLLQGDREMEQENEGSGYGIYSIPESVFDEVVKASAELSRSIMSEIEKMVRRVGRY